MHTLRRLPAFAAILLSAPSSSVDDDLLHTSSARIRLGALVCARGAFASAGTHRRVAPASGSLRCRVGGRGSRGASSTIASARLRFPLTLGGANTFQPPASESALDRGADARRVLIGAGCCSGAWDTPPAEDVPRSLLRQLRIVGDCPAARQQIADSHDASRRRCDEASQPVTCGEWDVRSRPDAERIFVSVDRRRSAARAARRGARQASIAAAVRVDRSSPSAIARLERAASATMPSRYRSRRMRRAVLCEHRARRGESDSPRAPPACSRALASKSVGNGSFFCLERPCGTKRVGCADVSSICATLLASISELCGKLRPTPDERCRSSLP
jgi:hypothetical protein